ncbi:MAG: glycosyltransferase family 2 protein [Betaproteobacteria bacterium]
MTSGGGSGAVSVLIPAYKPGARLAAVLESLAKQTCPDVLVQVSVDPDAEGPPPEVVGPPNLRLEVIHPIRRLGWVANANSLLAQVRTPFFILLGHDDHLTPTYIEAARDVLGRRPEVVTAHGSTRHHGLRDDILWTRSIEGVRLQRVLTFLERRPHAAGLGFRGVVRSTALKGGMRLRLRRSNGMFSNDLMALEMLLHGESAHIDGIYYDKFLYADGLSRDFHGRPVEERSAMFGDNIACLADMVTEAGFSAPEKELIVARYAEWLLTLDGQWNVLADAPSSDATPFAEIRPAVAHFVAMALLSAATPKDAAKE